MTTNKLISLGWIDAQGRELSWKDWQNKSRRVPVAYWREGLRRLEPVYEAQPSAAKVRRSIEHELRKR